MDKICNIDTCNNKAIWEAFPKDKREMSHYYCNACKGWQKTFNDNWDYFKKLQEGEK